MKSKMKKRPECGIACKTCPFRRENFNKPNPPGFDAANTEGDLVDWYSIANEEGLT